jgi:Rap1a immunity proteins
MTTKPARSRCSTSRLATISAMSLIGVHALAPLVAQCEGECRGKVGGVRERELLGGVGHWRTIAETSERSKNMLRAILIFAMLLAPSAWADPPDTSARKLLSQWKAQDLGLKLVAEVIASAFSNGFFRASSLGGKQSYCPPPGLKGQRIMVAFEQFLQDNPDLAESDYGEAMAATLVQAFPCRSL